MSDDNANPKNEAPPTEQPRASDGKYTQPATPWGGEATLLRAALSRNIAAPLADMALRVAKAENWTGDVGAKLEEFLGSLPKGSGEAARYFDGKEEAPPLKVPNSPQPGLDRKSHLPDDPFSLPPGVLAGMDKEAKMEYLLKWKERNIPSNPVTDIKSILNKVKNKLGK